MKKYICIVADPPYAFKDNLTMSNTKRGAASNYQGVLNIEELKKLPIDKLSADNSILALWVPSTLLVEGLDIMNAWGFKYKQNYIWVKTKINPLINLKINKKDNISFIKDKIKSFLINDILAIKMGHLFRQTHEICLIGTKGKLQTLLKNKAQRSVSLFPATKNSTKPEYLQDSLDIMFSGKKLELFARRNRKGWDCFGNECPTSLGEDIRDSLEKLIK